MKFSKKFSYRNLDGMFRLILLIYGRIMREYLWKFMYDNLKYSMIVNLTKSRFLEHFQKIELVDWYWLGIFHDAWRIPPLIM